MHGVNFNQNCCVFLIIKIHVRRAAGRGYSFIHLWMCLWVCTGPPGQTKNDTDLKLGNKQPKTISKNVFFLFFSIKRSCLEKLPRHADFTHISSIGFFFCCQRKVLYNGTIFFKATLLTTDSIDVFFRKFACAHTCILMQFTLLIFPFWAPNFQ